MRLLLVFVVILALTLIFWAMMGGVPVEMPLAGGDEQQQVSPEESVSLSGPGSDQVVRDAVKAEEMVRYRLVDGETSEALPYAKIYAIRTGKLLAECDEDGRAELSHSDPGQLFYLAEGYLLGFLLPDRRQLLALRAQAESKDVTVELYRDPFSFILELEFQLSNGEPAKEIEYRLQLAEPEGRAAAFLKELGRHSEGLRRAWNNEQKAPSHPAGLLKPRLIEARDRVLLTAKRLRFYLAGVYQITVIAKGGLRAEREVWIGPETEHLRFSLAPGKRITGQIFDGMTRQPVQSIRVTLNRGPFIRPVHNRSDQDGRFSFESLGTDSKRLTLSHGGYETLVLSAVTPGSELSLTMISHPRRELRGRVMTQGNGAPIAGALVRIFDSETHTDEDGTFFLGSTRAEGFVLHIEAEGHYAVDVTLAAGSVEHDYSMIPDQPEARVAAGITALLSGRVLHPGGEPVAGMDLSLMVDGEWTGLGIVKTDVLFRIWDPARRFFPPGQVTCDVDGNFTIECRRPGLISLRPMDGESSPIKINVALGQRYQNLIIYTKN